MIRLGPIYDPEQKRTRLSVYKHSSNIIGRLSKRRKIIHTLFVESLPSLRTPSKKKTTTTSTSNADIRVTDNVLWRAEVVVSNEWVNLWILRRLHWYVYCKIWIYIYYIQAWHSQHSFSFLVLLHSARYEPNNNCKSLLDTLCFMLFVGHCFVFSWMW